MKLLRTLAAAAVVLVVHFGVRAISISLPSTATDDNGDLLAGGAPDPHYTVTGPGVPNGGQAVHLSSGNQFGGWVPDDPHSGWIGFQDSFSSSPHGDYTYELQFSLGGIDPSKAVLNGSWAADQYGYITLDGNSTGVSVPDGNWNGGSFPNLNAFTISSGFQTGTNTLDFVVTEPDDGDALRVRDLVLWSPEPSGAIVLLVGIPLVALARRGSRTRRCEQ